MKKESGKEEEYDTWVEGIAMDEPLERLRGAPICPFRNDSRMDYDRYRTLIEIDGGYETVPDVQSAKNLLLHMFKVTLGTDLPEFRVETSGPPHDRVFRADIDASGLIKGGETVIGRGEAGRRVEAEKLACADAVRRIRMMEYRGERCLAPKRMRGSGNPSNPKTELNEIYQETRRENPPPYHVTPLPDGYFSATIDIEGRTFQGRGLSKSSATRDAALKALEHLRGSPRLGINE